MSERDKFLDAFMQESFGITNAADTLRKSGTEGLRAALDSAGVQAKSKDDEASSDVVKQANEKAMKQVAELTMALVEAQNDQEDRLNKMAKQVESYEGEIKTYQKAVQELTDSNKELRTLVAAGPQRPSQAQSTVLADDEAAKIKAKDDLERTKESQRWGVPMKAVSS